MRQTVEQLEEDYSKQKQQYEDKLGELRQAKQKGVQILEDIAESSRYYIKIISDDQSALYDGLRALDGLGDEFQYNCQREIKKLDNELEDIESDYRRNYLKVSEQKEDKKEETSGW